MKNVLLIAYNYPPMNNGGTARPYAFAKYLPRYGYRPIVITCDRAGAIEGEENVVRISDPEARMKETHPVLHMAFRLARKLLYKLGFLCGYLFLWQGAVLRGIDEVIEKEKPSAVIATYPPEDTLSIGYKISKRFSIPLIVDFRDGYCFEPLIRENFILRRKHMRMEKRYMRQTSAAISVVDAITQYLKSTYPGCSAITVPNGYDPEEWEQIGKQPDFFEAGKLHFVYTGRLSASRADVNLDSFFRAVNALTESEAGKISVHMIGEYSPDEMALDGNCKSVVRFEGLFKRADALQCQKNADYLLLYAGEAPGGCAGKLFEYIISGTPIVAFTQGSAAEHIITLTQTGICINSKDADAALALLKHILAIYPEKLPYSPNQAEICKYSRIAQVKALAQQLDAAF